MTTCEERQAGKWSRDCQVDECKAAEAVVSSCGCAAVLVLGMHPLMGGHMVKTITAQCAHSTTLCSTTAFQSRAHDCQPLAADTGQQPQDTPGARRTLPHCVKNIWPTLLPGARSLRSLQLLGEQSLWKVSL